MSIATILLILLLFAFSGAVAIFIQRQSERKKILAEKISRASEFIARYIPQFDLALSDWENLTSFGRGYFSHNDMIIWRAKYTHLPDKPIGIELALPGINEKHLHTIGNFCKIYATGDDLRSKYNNRFVEKELINYHQFFNDIEGRALDIQQRSAIVIDEDNNLVVAGAGTGKTTTIAGKVAYLIDRYNVDPSDILLISFTNKACDEMRQRIKKKMGINIEVKTFHKLGLDIISEVSDIRPNVFSLSGKETNEIFDGFLKHLMKDPVYLSLITKYFSAYLKPFKDENEFKSDGERAQYLKDMNMFGYKKVKLESGKEYRERLKSQEEVLIANFLYVHDIDYTYEEKYEYRTASKKFGQYKPDFKLNGFLNSEKKGTYIEHFGIDEFGNVPSWFKGDEDLSPKDKYNQGIIWKRGVHKEKGTTLIETYSYERRDGKLISNLIEKLRKQGIEIKEKTDAEVWSIIEKTASEDVLSFVQLVQTFLSLLKSNNYSIADINRKIVVIDNSEAKSRASAFIKVFLPIYREYEKLLKKREEVDFADMINDACKLVRSGQFKRKYKYILVDEFQDISISRYSLIKALKEQNQDCKLFCVGDDWQSIYRFSGSDISIFTEFEKYFGITSKSYIERTYRFADNLIAVSSEFILKNPKQFAKGLKTSRIDDTKPYEIIRHKNQANEIYKPVEEAIQKILECINDQQTSITVLLLGRYNHELNGLKDAPDLFQIHWSVKDENYSIRYLPKPDLRITFLTVHAAKGLEADYVILMNGNSGKYGFPSQISDDPLLNLVLTEADQYENGEERRLFYVALTRTRNKVYILSNEDYKSKFVIELENRDSNIQLSKCPWCETGSLILREGQYGLFYGCSNYPHFCNFTNKISGEEIFKLGEAERKAENYDAALEYYKKAISTGTFPQLALYYAGLSNYKLKKYHDCITQFQLYVERNNLTPYSYYWLGLAHLELKEFDKSIKCLEKALELKSDYYSALYYRSKAQLKNKMYESAIAGFSSYLLYVPNDINSFILRGEARILNEDSYGAWHDWKEAEKLGSTTVKSFFDYYDLTNEPIRPKLNRSISNNYSAIFNEIDHAVKNGHVIKFKYQKSTAFNSGEFCIRTIKPKIIEEVGVTKSPCVKGYCYWREEDRTFAIERISELIIDPLSIEFGDIK